MIKATANDLIILGLSRNNVERIQKGDPIKFDGADIGLPGKKFLIIYGETENDIAEILGVDTDVTGKTAN